MTNLELNFENSNDYRGNLKPLSQVRFEAGIETEVSPILQIISTAFENMRSEVDELAAQYKNHLSKSTRMNEQIKGLLIDRYGDKVKRLPYNRFGLMHDGRMLLFKKLDGKNKPSNILTRNARSIATQGRLNFPGEPEIVFIGFTVTPGYGRLTSVKAVKIENNEVQWMVNLNSLDGAAPMPIVQNNPVQGGPVVRLKNKDDKEAS